jgi:hypothetical protein
MTWPLEASSGAVPVGGEAVLGREPTDVADLAKELGGQHRPDAEQLEQAGLGPGDRGRDTRLNRDDPPVQVADVGDQVAGGAPPSPSFAAR